MTALTHLSFCQAARAHRKVRITQAGARLLQHTQGLPYRSEAADEGFVHLWALLLPLSADHYIFWQTITLTAKKEQESRLGLGLSMPARSSKTRLFLVSGKGWQAALEGLLSCRNIDLAAAGIGIHHAGMDYRDRKLMEALFLKNHLHVICTTSTLAVGINLPARMVIIKGTKIWDAAQVSPT